MRIICIIMILFLFSCSNKKSKKGDNIPDIDSIKFEITKESSDYNDYSEFILHNSNSCYFFDALDIYDKMRTKMIDSLGDIPILECWRNCALIDLNTKNEIAYEGMKISLSALHDSLLSFFININNSEKLPEKRIFNDNKGIPHEISNGRIELHYVNDSCDFIQDVIKEISESINSYKNYIANTWYSTELNTLSRHEKNIIDSLMRYRLILYRYEKYYILPPPPLNE